MADNPNRESVKSPIGISNKGLFLYRENSDWQSLLSDSLNSYSDFDTRFRLLYVQVNFTGVSTSIFKLKKRSRKGTDFNANLVTLDLSDYPNATFIFIEGEANDVWLQGDEIEVELSSVGEDIIAYVIIYVVEIE